MRLGGKGLVTTKRCLGCAKSAVFILSKQANEITLSSYQFVHFKIFLNRNYWISTTKAALSHKILFVVRGWGLVLVSGPCERAGPGPHERAGPCLRERAGSRTRPTSWLVVFYTLVPRYNHYQLLPRQHHCRKDMTNIHLCCLDNRLFISNTSSLWGLNA